MRLVDLNVSSMKMAMLSFVFLCFRSLLMSLLHNQVERQRETWWQSGDFECKGPSTVVLVGWLFLDHSCHSLSLWEYTSFSAFCTLIC